MPPSKHDHVHHRHHGEQPGAHHNFDMFESIRSAAVNEAVAAFTAQID